MQKNKLTPPKNLPRRLIVDLYCRNYSLSEIADQCNEHLRRKNHTTRTTTTMRNTHDDNNNTRDTTPRTVTSRDVYMVLHKSKIRWQERESQDRAELRSEELKRIDNLEREYWEAWFRSIDMSQSQTQNSEKYNAITDGADGTSSYHDTYDDEDVIDPDELRDKWGKIPTRASKRNSKNSYGTSTSGRNSKSARNSYAPVSISGMSQTEVKISKKLVETCGDPRFLKGIERCIEMRRQMLGLDAPTRSITGQMSPEMLRQMAREMAPSYGMEPDDIAVDDVVSEVEHWLAQGRSK